MLKTYTFRSGVSGPNILILGLIHGNEPCGKIAINQFIEKINKNEINIIKGNITFIPICNPEAYKKNIRYKDENLNRIFQKYETPISYEQGLANEITSFINESDYLLDIHSTTQDTSAFVFQDYDDIETKNLAMSLQTLWLKSGQKYSLHEIKKAYRRWVLETHPDSGGTNDELRQVVNAWEWLRY